MDTSSEASIAGILQILITIFIISCIIEFIKRHNKSEKELKFQKAYNENLKVEKILEQERAEKQTQLNEIAAEERNMEYEAWLEKKKTLVINILNSDDKHKRHELLEMLLSYSTYTNHCWKCKTPINSEYAYQCDNCHTYICPRCGHCLIGDLNKPCTVDYYDRRHYDNAKRIKNYEQYKIKIQLFKLYVVEYHLYPGEEQRWILNSLVEQSKNKYGNNKFFERPWSSGIITTDL